MTALLGFATIGLFTVLVMTHRISAVAGLILIPVMFSLLGGFRPKVSDMLDYEGELAVIIGKGGHHIDKEDALDHVA